MGYDFSQFRAHKVTRMLKKNSRAMAKHDATCAVCRRRRKAVTKPTTWYIAKQLRKFWYWINERHQIYLKRKAGEPWPWTDDPILKDYKFTNVYRQLDRQTQEWLARYSKFRALDKRSMKPNSMAFKADVLFECMQFRLFNWAPTYDALKADFGYNWNLKRAIRVLTDRKENGNDEERKLFTGAYIIPSGGSRDPKLETICRALDWVHKHRADLIEEICSPYDIADNTMLASMENTVNVLQNIFTVGPFIAYEIACDLRFTCVLNDASDIRSWANPGPGAKRGINRLMTGKPKISDKPPDYIAAMRDLLSMSQDSLEAHVFNSEGYPFELREIEHSLCEFDKYMRVKNGEGRPRARYKTPDERYEDAEHAKAVAFKRNEAYRQKARLQHET